MIILFRHGETDWNRCGRFQGHMDIPLNQKGRDQAHQLKMSLAGLKLDLILSSDLLRAKETASIIRNETPTIFSPCLRENNIGEPAGLTKMEIMEQYGSLAWESWKDLGSNFSFPMGESNAAHAERVWNFLRPYLESEPRNLAISTHEGSLRHILRKIGAPSWNDPIPNCTPIYVKF